MNVAIPEWWSVEAKRQSVGELGLTALEWFVLVNEPADPLHAQAFRDQLALVVQEVVGETPR